MPAAGIFDDYGQYHVRGEPAKTAAERAACVNALLPLIFDGLARCIHAGKLDEWVNAGPEQWPIAVNDVYLGLIEDFLAVHGAPAEIAPLLRDQWNALSLRPVQLQPIFHRRARNIAALNAGGEPELYVSPPAPRAASPKTKRSVSWTEPGTQYKPHGIARLAASALPAASSSASPSLAGRKRERSSSPGVTSSDDETSTAAPMQLQSASPRQSASSTRTAPHPLSVQAVNNRAFVDPSAIPLSRFLPSAAQSTDPAYLRAAAKNLVSFGALPSMERLRAAAAPRPASAALAPLDLSNPGVPSMAQIRRELRPSDFLTPTRTEQDGGLPLVDAMSLYINPSGYGNRGIDSIDPAAVYNGKKYEPGVTPESALVWMSRFIKAAMRGQWNDKLCLDNLRTALAGPAAEWYEHIMYELPNDELTFANLAERLILQYEGRQMSVQDYRNSVKAQLRHDSTDTVGQFISKAEALLYNQYGQWNEISRVEAISEALHPTIKSFMKTHAWGPYASVTELQSAAIKAEAYIRKNPVLALQYKSAPEEAAADLAEKATPAQRGRNTRAIPITTGAIKQESVDDNADGGMAISPPPSSGALDDLQARIASLQRQVDRPRTPPPTILPMPYFASPSSVAATTAQPSLSSSAPFRSGPPPGTVVNCWKQSLPASRPNNSTPNRASFVRCPITMLVIVSKPSAASQMCKTRRRWWRRRKASPTVHLVVDQCDADAVVPRLEGTVDKVRSKPNNAMHRHRLLLPASARGNNWTRRGSPLWKRHGAGTRRPATSSFISSCPN